MEYISKPQERAEKPSSPANSPNNSSSNGGNHSLSSSNGVQIPTTPKPNTPRSDSNPYPTTFVQADSSNFKQVVQMLTGSSETIKQTPSRQAQDPSPPTRNFNIPPKKQGSFKLYERRNHTNLKNSLMINTLIPNFNNNNSGFSPRKPEILSPSLLDFPSLTLSPVTPLLNDDAFDKSSSSPSMGNSSTSSSSAAEEERAIAEKGFYLHPSPMTTPRDAEPPQLLPLFPVTSPRVSGSAASS